MKVLFDTNVYVSEALAGGLAKEIIDSVLQSRGRIFATEFIAIETERVLVDKLGRDPRLAKLQARRIRRRSDIVGVVSSRHLVPDDPHDTPILRAAVEAGVDFLVTSDHHLLKLTPYEGIPIVSMRDFRLVLQ